MSASQADLRPFWRKHLLAIVLVLISLGLALAFTVNWVLRESSPQFSAQVDTPQGQSREIRLEDGSEIIAGGGTELSVGVYARRRDVNLAHGQVYFRVVYKFRTNLNVRMGVNEVNVLASAMATPDTLFDVQLDGERLAVRVKQGQVKVRTQSAGPREFVELSAGQAVVVDLKQMRHEVSQIDPASVGDWR
ncbi:FecR domain-containing protein [Bordetella pseudohinzii]|uniref:Fec operon regulator FecR n=1 Tax=Bordetella pseudohinzii TaxID=1331258 RepID=A0A0J6C9L9_9BORD|nr:FecR domain-containing protein [Bordetella pseudohinzii]ANY15058.1 iron transport sensor protein [Bordetella pseudohinzii]KMM26097.1 iron transport sensor protein [Bordetella pseudohinzii]KXA79827.1 iron transport sensor protein [Bordetella pseudohinzii]KXA82830.1 iron transport sensor protein [Bordetella pseudohinzii]CUI53371.1 fec operon regulator FecR [Bordetella pseudohinzii]